MQRGGITTFRSKFFCLTVPKNIVGELFGVSENFVYRKILCIRRGYHWTPLKNFCLTVPIKFVEEPFCVSKEFWYGNFSSKGGEKLHGFVKFFFYLTGSKKLRQGTILCCRKFLVGKNILWIKRGVSRFSVETFLSDCTKIFH